MPMAAEFRGTIQSQRVLATFIPARISAPTALGYPGNGSPITGDQAREEVTIWKDWHDTVGSIDLKPRGLGGWALDVQHVYDTVGHVLDLGSGGRQSAQTVRSSDRQSMRSAIC